MCAQCCECTCSVFSHHNPGRGHWHRPRRTDEGMKAPAGKVTCLKSHH